MINRKDLIEISSILQKSLSADETYQAVFQLLERILPFDSATLFLHNPDSNKLEVALKKGENVVDLVDDVSFARGNGLSGWVSQQKQPVVIPSLSNCRPERQNRFKSFLSMPLWAGEKFIGVLNLGHYQRGTYGNESMDDYQLIAMQISVVVDKLNHKNQLDRQNCILKETVENLNSTQQKLVEKERLAAIGEIVVTINHEINNPLTTIIGYVNLLPSMIETHNQKKVKECVQIILDAAVRIKKITHQLSHLKSTKNVQYLNDIKMIALSEEE